MEIANAPDTQLVDAQQLTADAYNHLYQIALYPTGFMYFCPEHTITWQGNTYQYWGLTLTGISKTSDDSSTRPTLNMANFTYASDGSPINGVFSALQAQSKIEGATVTRYKVLKTHADSNQNIFSRNQWKISKILKATPQIISFELRNTLDGPVFMMPARLYIPPEFPQVSLQ